MSMVTGLQCKAYYNTGTQDTPVWVEANLIINLDHNKQHDTVESSCRKAGGLKQFVLGQRDDEASFNLCHDNADAVWEFFRDAFESKDVVHMEILDGDRTVTGTDGSVGTWYITTSNESQQLSSAVEDALTLKPSANGLTASDSAIAPTRTTIA